MAGRHSMQMRSSTAFQCILALVVASPTFVCGQQAERQAPFFRGDRILIRAAIDGQNATFAFDTGASVSALFESSARRLNVLKGEKVTETFELSMFGEKARVRLPVVPIVTADGIDGVFAWSNLSAKRLLIDGHDRIVSTPSELPSAEGWKRWKSKDENGQTFFEVTSEGETLGRVFFDTGATCGLRLREDRWASWRKENSEIGVTLEPFRYALGETTVQELAWASEIRVGDLVLYDVPVTPLPEEEAKLAGDDYLAMIGTAALRNLRVLLDRETNEVWTQSIRPAMDHNRAGAVFAARKEDGRLVAHVLKGGPADEAGLVDGDLLVSIDDNSPTTEREANRPFRLPAGTSVTLTVERNDERKDLSIELKDLLP